MSTAIIWGFFYFVFIKVYCSLFFSNPISIIAALLISVAVLLIEMAFSPYYAKQMQDYLNHPVTTENDTYRKQNKLLWDMIKAYVLFLIPTSIVSLLITLGFSEQFYRDHLRGDYREWLNWDDTMVFFLGLAIMTSINVVLVVYGLRKTKVEG